MQSMDFKVKKYIQNAKLCEFEKHHHNEGDLDTLEKIDQKFNDFCTVYEKQFDQILSKESTKSNLSHKSFSKSQINLDGGYRKQQTLNKQSSGINLNGSVDNLYAGSLTKNSNSNQVFLQTQKSKVLNKNGSMPQIYSPNFIIRKSTNEFGKIKSQKSFTNFESNEAQISPLKTNGKTQQNNYVSQTSLQGIMNNLVKNQGTQNNKTSRIDQTSQIGFPSQSTQTTLNYKFNEDGQKFQRSLSRKRTALESPQKSLAVSPMHNTPNKILSNVASQRHIQNYQQTKTVKFADEGTQIKSLKNIEEIQDNLVKIGIGSLMLEQLRLSQIDLNKIEDINSFSDRQSLLSSKILKEFGIGQSQVVGFKKEQEKQEYIMKTINNTVTGLYKKWIKSYEERQEKIENMEDEYQDLKSKLNKREKQDFEQIKVDTEYKALENELKQLIVKKLNDYETQTFILENVQLEKQKQQQQDMPKTQQNSMTSLPNKKNSIDSKEYTGSMSNGLESPPQSPLQVGDQNKFLKSVNTYSIRVISNEQDNGSLQKEQTPRKHSIDLNKNSYAKQVQNYPQTSRGYIQDRYSHLASTVMHTDHSNMTDVNTSITKQSGKKGTSAQLDSQHNYRRSFNQSATNLSSYNNNAEESILLSIEKQNQNSIQKMEMNQLDDYKVNRQREQEGQIASISQRTTNRDGKKYIYGENTYVKEEILDEKLANKITEYVDKSDQIKELGEKLYSQIDWKIELDSAFIELRKENRKKNNKISKGNNMNLITFFPIMQDIFKNLKSDRNKEKLMQRYREGEMLTNEQLSFLASTNQLLNRFIDRDYLDKGLKFFQKKGIQSNLEFLLAENIIKTYELIKEIIFFHRKNYLYQKNKQLLYEQEMFKQRQEQKIIDLEKAKEKIKMNKRMEAVCRSLDKKIIAKEEKKMESQNRQSFLNNKDKSQGPANHVAQKFVDNIKKSILEKQSLRDTFINHISLPKQAIKIEEIKQKKKDNQEKQKVLDKISAAEGADLLQRLQNKAIYEDDPKNQIRRSYHPSSKLFVEEHRDEYKQITPNERKIVETEIKRFKRKFIQSKNQEQEGEEKNNFASFYTGGPLQSSYINSKYYGERQIKTIIRVQAVARGYLARKILKALKEKKKREQEIRRKAEKTREKMLLKERIKLELYSPKGIIDKMTPKSKKSQNGSPKVGFSDAVSSKKIKKKSRFSRVQRKSILTQAHFDLAMQNEMKLNYHRKVILNQDVSNRFQKLINAAKQNNFAYIEKGKFQFFTMDVNKCDELKNSPLYYAAYHGNIYFCQYLVELGADVNQVCQEGSTPFHMACQSNNKNLIMLFIQAGGNLDKVNIEGLTPLSYASFDILEQLDAMKVISLRDTNIKQNFRNLKIFKRGAPQSEFQTSAIEYDNTHLFTSFPSQNKQQQPQ